LAKEADVSGEWIRLVVKKLFTPQLHPRDRTPLRPELAKIISKDRQGFWQIPRSWADKYLRLRAAHQAAQRKERELKRTYYKSAIQNNPLDAYYMASESIVVNGKPETIVASRLAILIEAFGPLPMRLDAEEETVLRSIEVLNLNRRSRPWTNELAWRIEKEGPLWIERP
jgi:hypothetical protein